MSSLQSTGLGEWTTWAFFCAVVATTPGVLVG